MVWSNVDLSGVAYRRIAGDHRTMLKDVEMIIVALLMAVAFVAQVVGWLS